MKRKRGRPETGRTPRRTITLPQKYIDWLNDQPQSQSKTIMQLIDKEINK